MVLASERIRVIVYDLDGTVYDDTRHFEIYARMIMDELPGSVRAPYWADYTATLAGTHPALTVGCFYDADRDLVLRPRGGRVARALHWDGTVVEEAQQLDWYPGVVDPDHQHILNVGDLWWVPSAISRHYGGDAAKGGQCFLRIREMMADPGFVIKPIPGFADLVAALRPRVRQVLATNSPQPDSEAIIGKIGLTGLLDRHFFGSNKPAGLRNVLELAAKEYQCPMDAILSVGDNLVNEIAPAAAAGCQTVFIDPHGLGEVGDADLIVRNMAELIPILRKAFID